MKSGIINFLKPTGLTSSDAVVRVRRALSRRDVGHLGTLDPYAAGVLPIAVGKATRLFDYFLAKNKTYRAFIRFGYRSDTLDTAGAAAVCGRIPSIDEVLRAVPSFVGELDQVPPSYSAKSVNGVRAYDLARKTGREVILPPKRITVYSFDYVRNEGTDFVFDVACSSGTYIRALARDLGEKLGTNAVLSALIRTQCGAWSLENTVTSDELTMLGEQAVIPIEDVLRELPVCRIDPAYRKRLDNGSRVPCEQAFSVPFTVWCEDTLYGLGDYRDGMVGIATYLKDNE